ncbi:hypothetical protein ACOMHN_017372 [Nucella lapillus]
MSRKRGAGDLDPDYQDLAEQQAKRQRVLEKDARQASVDAMQRIVMQQFKVELDSKEAEAKEADKVKLFLSFGIKIGLNKFLFNNQQLHEARKMMDQLRAVIIAHYYCSSRDETKKMTEDNALPSIHPTAKKHLGKAPVGMGEKAGESDPPSSSQSSQSSVPSKAAVKEPTHKSGDHEEEGSSRLSVRRTIVVGNSSKFLLPHQRQSTNPSSHKWMVYVRGPRDKPDVSDILSKVWFFLHPSYKPFDLVEVREPPFHLSRQGWGEFPVRVQLHFKDQRNKRVDIIHNLVLDKTCTGVQTLGAETMVTVDVVRDPVPGSRHRPSVPHPPTPITETVVKEEPLATDPQSTAVRAEFSCAQSHDSDENTSGSATNSGESGEKIPQGRAQNDEGKAPDTNIPIKKEPPGDCEAVSSTVRAPVQSNIVIKTEPEADGRVLKNSQTDPRRVSEQNTCDGNAVSKPLPAPSNAGSSYVNEADRFASEKSGLMNSRRTENGQRKDTSLNSVSGRSATALTQNSAPVGLGGESNAKPPAHSSVGRVNCQAGSVSQMVKVTLPQKCVNSQAQVVGNIPPQKTGGSVSTASVVQGSKKWAQTTPDGQLNAPQCAHGQKRARDGTTVISGGAQGRRKTTPAVAGQGGAVSLLTGLQQEVGLTSTAAPAAMLKVTAQGLRPVLPTAPPPVRAPATPTPPPAVHIVQGGRGSVVVMTPRSAVSTVANGNNNLRSGSRSLLQTAAKPAIRALLQKSAQSGPQSVSVPQGSCVSAASRKPQSLLTPSVLSSLSVPKVSQSAQSLLVSSAVSSLSVTSASHNSQSLFVSSAVSSSSVTSASRSSQSLLVPSAVTSSSVPASPHVGVTSASPTQVGTSSNRCVVAQVNNKKILLQLGASPPVTDISATGSQLKGKRPESGSIVNSFVGSHRAGQGRTAAPVKHSLLTGHAHTTAGQQPGGQMSVITFVSNPATSTPTARPSPNMGASKGNRYACAPHAGYASRTAMELAMARAVIQSRSLLQFKSAAHLAKQKTHETQEVPLKPRCGRWFSQDLGSSLALGADTDHTGLQRVEKGGGVRTVTPAPEVKVKVEEGAGKEKRIMVVKKKANTGLDLSLTGTPVADLSIDQYSSMTALMKAAVVRHPLLAPECEKTVHPYTAVSVEQWNRWHPVKRNACEWSRAVAVRKYLKRWLGAEETFRGDKLWSTKRVMQWCRCCGLSPNGPGGRPLVMSGPQTEEWEEGTGDGSEVPHTVSDFEGLSSEFHCQDKHTAKDDDSLAELDIVALEPSRREKPSPLRMEQTCVGQAPHFDSLPETAEAQFVQDTAAEVGVKLSTTVLAPDVVSNTTEDMIFAAMLEFANELLHQACFAASAHTRTNSQEGPSISVRSRDVTEAMRALPAASFLTRQHCGVPNPPTSPAKR